MQLARFGFGNVIQLSQNDHRRFHAFERLDAAQTHGARIIAQRQTIRRKFWFNFRNMRAIGRTTRQNHNVLRRHAALATKPMQDAAQGARQIGPQRLHFNGAAGRRYRMGHIDRRLDLGEVFVNVPGIAPICREHERAFGAFDGRGIGAQSLRIVKKR